MQTPKDDPHAAHEDQAEERPEPALTATQRAFAEIERRSRAMAEGWRTSGL